MFSDDRKVWSRFFESTKSEATLEMLISWMTITCDQAFFFFLRVKAKYGDLYLDRLDIGREGMIAGQVRMTSEISLFQALGQ